MAALRSPARNLIAPSADCAGSAAWGANRITLRLVRPGVAGSAGGGGTALAGAGLALAICLGGEAFGWGGGGGGADAEGADAPKLSPAAPWSMPKPGL